jgi:hypothetical protein
MSPSVPSSRARYVRALLLAGCSGLAVMALAGPPAQAQTSVSATSTWTVGPTPGNQSEATPAFPSPDISPSASDGSGDSIFGHVYGYPNGGNFFGSRSSGQGNFGITGTLDYKTTFINTTGGVINPALAFVIDGGDLQVTLPTGSGTLADASLTAVITESINGGPTTSLFSYASVMLATNPAANPSFTETGAIFNPAGATLSAGQGDYSWAAYNGDVSLGALNPGDSVLLDYTLVSSANGIGTCTGGGGGYGVAAITSVTGIGGGGSCDTALARIGDPFTVNGASPFDLPEPASAAGLGAGLAGLAFMRKRRRPA